MTSEKNLVVPFQLSSERVSVKQISSFYFPWSSCYPENTFLRESDLRSYDRVGTVSIASMSNTRMKLLQLPR